MGMQKRFNKRYPKNFFRPVPLKPEHKYVVTI
jgi:hypothetical protein